MGDPVSTGTWIADIAREEEMIWYHCGIIEKITVRL